MKVEFVGPIFCLLYSYLPKSARGFRRLMTKRYPIKCNKALPTSNGTVTCSGMAEMEAATMDSIAANHQQHFYLLVNTLVTSNTTNLTAVKHITMLIVLTVAPWTISLVFITMMMGTLKVHANH
jgi:hypothetical protein